MACTCLRRGRLAEPGKKSDKLTSLRLSTAQPSQVQLSWEQPWAASCTAGISQQKLHVKHALWHTCRSRTEVSA
eukprot:1141700-Pelagomonas_calceolata.AAC.5